MRDFLLVAGLMVAVLTLAFGLVDNPQASWADRTSESTTR